MFIYLYFISIYLQIYLTGIQYSIQLYLERLNILQIETNQHKMYKHKESFLPIHLSILRHHQDSVPTCPGTMVHLSFSWFCLPIISIFLSTQDSRYLLIPVNILWKKSKLNSIFNEARYIALHQMDYSHCHSFCILQNIRVIFKNSLFNSNIRCLANHKTDMILL